MKKKLLQLLIQKVILRIRILQLRLERAIGMKVTYPRYEVKGAMVHHGGGDWTFEQVNQHHKDLWGFKSSLGFYCGYHKFIDPDGTIHIARRDGEEGAHAVGNIPRYYNRHYIGINVWGNTEPRQATGEQLRVLEKELDKYREAGLEILYHAQVSATLCPGRHLIEWLQNYLNSPIEDD